MAHRDREPVQALAFLDRYFQGVKHTSSRFLDPTHSSADSNTVEDGNVVGCTPESNSGQDGLSAISCSAAVTPGDGTSHTTTSSTTSMEYFKFDEAYLLHSKVLSMLGRNQEAGNSYREAIRIAPSGKKLL